MGVVLYRVCGWNGNHYATKNERMAVVTTAEQEERRDGDVE